MKQKRAERSGRASVSLGTISRGEKIHRAPQKRKERTENTLRSNGQNFSSFDRNYESTHSRSSVSPKYKKHEENYSKAQLNALS